VEREEDLLLGGNETMNVTRILTREQQLLKQEKEKEADKKLKEMLKDMTTCLEAIGMVNPMNKVYNLAKDLDHFPLVACLITINALNLLTYDPHIYSLVRKNKESVADGAHFIVGLVTVFKQFHPHHYKKYLLYFSHYFKNLIHAASTSQTPPKTLLPPDAYMTLIFLE
jgi:hypothetical protein